MTFCLLDTLVSVKHETSICFRFISLGNSDLSASGYLRPCLTWPDKYEIHLTLLQTSNPFHAMIAL